MISKTLFNYCQKHLRFPGDTQLKANASLRSLVNQYNIGTISDGLFYCNDLDKRNLSELIAQQLNGIRLSDNYPQPKSRDEIAKHQRNEKVGAITVSEDFVLINTLNTLQINGQIVNSLPLSSLGQLLCASEINSIEHQQIILVENLTVMANLPRLNIPTNLKDALWLYRGDSQKFQHTGTASKFYKCFQNTHQLICFSDFDPAGLQIALTCSATQWLTLQSIDDLNTELLGYEHEWFKQTNAIKYINDKAYLPDPIQLLFSAMNHHQKTLKQEHMLAHDLPLVCYKLL